MSNMKRRLWRPWSLMAIVIVISLVVVGCAPPQPPAVEKGPETRGGDLVYGLGFEPSLIDPHQAGSFDAHLMFMNIYDVLVWLGLDGNYYPGLATEWSSEDDGQVWTFKLREDVTFHDGTPFDANVMKFNFDRVVDPETRAFLSRDLIGPYDHSEVVDDYTIKVYFTRPYSAFLDAVSQHFLSPVSPAALEKYGDDYARNQVGTGPFMWKEYVAKDHMTLVRNPDYNWAPEIFGHQGPAYLDSITFTFIPSPATRAGVLETGEIHIAEDPPLTEAERLTADAGFNLIQAVLPGQPTVLLLNTESGPTSDLAVRQALNYGIDKDGLIQLMFRGLSEPAYGPLSRTTAFYSDAVESMYPYDPEMAAQILDEAGWTVGSDGIREKDGQRLVVELNTMGFNRYPEIFQVSQAQWKEIGIDVNLNVMPSWPQFSSAGRNGEHGMMPYFQPASDPHFALTSFFHSANIGTGINFTRYRDETLDRLLDEGSQTTDAAERARIYDEVQRIVMDNALIVPVYLVYNNTVVRAEVKDLRFDKRGWYAWLYDVYIEE